MKTDVWKTIFGGGGTTFCLSKYISSVVSGSACPEPTTVAQSPSCPEPTTVAQSLSCPEPTTVAQSLSCPEPITASPCTSCPELSSLVLKLPLPVQPKNQSRKWITVWTIPVRMAVRVITQPEVMFVCVLSTILETVVEQVWEINHKIIKINQYYFLSGESVYLLKKNMRSLNMDSIHWG